MKKALMNCLTYLSAAVFVWELISYAEILMKNASPNPVYSAFNLITVMSNLF